MEPSHFTVMVEDPNTSQLIQFHARADEPELTLAHVMNLIAFDGEEQGEKFDANFISYLNQET